MTRPLTAYDQLQQTDSHDALIRLSRKFLSQDRVDAWVDVFTEYQRRCPDRRWGLDNPLESILGPLRIKAIYILQRPQHQAYHDIAAFILYEASKPKDIPLALSLLAKQSLEHSELVECLSWLLQEHHAHISLEQQQQLLQIVRRFDDVETRRAACQYAVLCLRLSSPELLQWAYDYFERMPLTTSFHYYWERACHLHEPMIEVLTRKIATSSFDTQHDYERFARITTQAIDHHDSTRRRLDNWLGLLNRFEDGLGVTSFDTLWWKQEVNAFSEMFEHLYVEERSAYCLQQTMDRLFDCLPQCLKQPDALYVWFLLIEVLDLTDLTTPLRHAIWSCLSHHHDRELRLLALEVCSLPHRRGFLEADDVKRIFCAVRYEDDVELIEQALSTIYFGTEEHQSLWPIFLDMLQSTNIDVVRCVAENLACFYGKSFQPTIEHRWALQYLHDQIDDPQTFTDLRIVLRAMNEHLDQ